MQYQLCSILFILLNIFQVNCGINSTHILSKLLLNYDPSRHPNENFNTITPLDVNLYIVQMYGVNDVNMDFWVIFYLRQRWVDKRLKWKQFNGAKDNGDSSDNIHLQGDMLYKIWLPDTSFLNDRQSKFHDVSKPNKMLRIYSSGRILFSQRISAKMSCQMNLKKFPFDSQHCEINLISLRYPTNKVELHWSKRTDPIEINQKFELPDFHLSTFDYHTSHFQTPTGITSDVFTKLMVRLKLQRLTGHFLIHTYIPSVLLVIISWLSFWLDVEAISARVTVGILTVLTMITLRQDLYDIPKVSYVKAIDIWNSTCLTFVFLALLEFTVVNVIVRRLRLTGNCPKDKNKIFFLYWGNDNKKNGNVFPEDDFVSKLPVYIERTSRLVFPMCFMTFNIIYWLIFIE
ncbi:hypothetical protein SNEBB_008221 [Seison nebaliae]|nr:hypothetical protein SNEBB_008221 [Seison nebaliae]